MANESKKPFKKRLIIILIILAGLLLVMYLLTLILPKVLDSIASQNTEEGTVNFDFYEPDYNENIYEDEEYIRRIEDGIITYDNATNSISAVNLENASEFGETVEFLTNYIYTIIEGNAEEYNGFFSKRYFEKNSPKERFTMQKIYDAKITYFSMESVSEDGVNYTKYIYQLSYKILENNGTFRQDIGDQARTQYVLITDREGKLLIDGIDSAKYKLPT